MRARHKAIIAIVLVPMSCSPRDDEHEATVLWRDIIAQPVSQFEDEGASHSRNRAADQPAFAVEIDKGVKERIGSARQRCAADTDRGEGEKEAHC